MNIYVACAEHDKSRPHGWRLAIDCVFLGGAEHDESCPYGSRPALLNRSMILRFLPLLLATFKENVYIYSQILHDR